VEAMFLFNEIRECQHACGQADGKRKLVEDGELRWSKKERKNGGSDAPSKGKSVEAVEQPRRAP